MNMNVTIAVLDIRQVPLPLPFHVLLICVMSVYIVSTCATLYIRAHAPAPESPSYTHLENGTEITL